MKELDLLRKIKSVSFATVEDGIPQVRIIDVMLIENDKLYFTTARGKAFYRQIMHNKYVAIVGMDANYKTIRVSGPVEMADRTYVDKIFEENPMMNDLYAGKKRDILDAFCLYKGVGEVFDLSTTPPFRERFSFGGELVRPVGFVITADCIACGICKEGCPEGAISEGKIYKIDENHCIECGRCYENCPHNAIKQPIGF
ncbi:MAG: 4Fe-4S binding protein [Sedimentibacter sp.]